MARLKAAKRGSAMNLNQVLVILNARRRVIFGVFGGVLFLVIALSVIWPKQYTAVSSIVVDAKTDPVTAGAGGGYSEQMLQSYVNTQADVVGSRRVAQRVVKQLKLDTDPELQSQWRKATKGVGDFSVWLGDYIVDRKLTVAPVHDSPNHASNVIEISVSWRNAALAAALANAFAQSAIDTNIELKVEPAKLYAGWFNQRSRALRDDLAAKQKRLSDFQNSTGLVATDEKLDVENARLTELSSQLVTIQALRQESQSRQRGVGGDIESLPEVLQSPVIQSLKAELSQAEARQPDIAARLGKNHPDYQAAVGEIANLKERIARESASIAASLGNTTQVNLRRENDVRQALEAQKNKVLELKHAHDQAAIFENDVNSAQRDLDAVTQRFAQSSLESQTSQTNVVQLTVATPPLGPSSPKLVLNALIGIFLGGLFGIGAALFLESLHPRVRLDEDLLHLLGVPLLGKIGSVTPRAIEAGIRSSSPLIGFRPV
jgi:chain length determinant protein EpsF